MRGPKLAVIISYPTSADGKIYVLKLKLPQMQQTLSATATKNQFYFFFVFQTYVTEPLSDRSFKPSFQKDTCLFWLKSS